MSRIDDDVINSVRERADIVDVVSKYVQLNRRGSNYLGLCPFHNEKTPSFTVSPSKGIFHCFGCGEGGDAIGFIMKKENLSFTDAVTKLAEELGIEIKLMGDTDPKQRELYEKRIAINKAAAMFFLERLQTSPIAIEYLKKRSISYETARKFGIGYAPAEWSELTKYLNNKGYDLDEARVLRLISRNKNNDGDFDFFRNRLMFPIIDTRRRVLGFGGRVFDKSLPKYLNSPDTPLFNKRFNIYGLNILAKESNRERIILVEGYMDVIGLYEHGINYAVACLGTALTAYQAKLIKQYGKEIYVCLDADEAGRRAARRAIEVFKQVGVVPKFVVLSNGMDPDEYVKAYGKGAFEDKVKSAISAYDFEIMLRNGAAYQEDGELEKIKDIASIIASIESPIERDLYIRRYAKELGVTAEAFADEIAILRQGSEARSGQSVRVTANAEVPVRAYDDIERKAIAIALRDSYMREELSRFFEPQDFSGKAEQEIFDRLRATLDPTKAMEVLEELYAEKKIDIETFDFYHNYRTGEMINKSAVDELVRRLRRSEFEGKRNEILQRLRISVDESEKVKLIEELSIYNKMLSKI